MRVSGRGIERKTGAFCASFPLLCYLSSIGDGGGGAQDLDTASSFRANFTVWPPWCENGHHEEGSQGPLGMPATQRGPLYSALFKSMGLKHFTHTNLVAFFKAWVRERLPNEVRQSDRVGFTVVARNLSGKASICNNPIEVSRLGNRVPTFQIKK